MMKYPPFFPFFFLMSLGIGFPGFVQETSLPFLSCLGKAISFKVTFLS